MAAERAPRSRGSVVAVRGSVIDASFADGLPEIRDMLRLGDDVVAEVSAHLDAHTVRCLAMNPTQGLGRGDPAVDSGEPITVPVGSGLLGRAIDVFGDPIDELGEIEAEERRPIY